MDKDDAAERFLSAPQLAEVDPESRRVLLSIMVEANAAAGAVLLEQGQPNDHLSFLIQGSAAIERPTAGGGTENIATLNAPALFGTTSFFRPTPPTVSVRATTDVKLLTLHHPAFERIRRENPRATEALLLAVIRVLSERFDLLDRRLSDHLAQHHGDHPKMSELSNFRARLFEEPNL